MKPDRVLVGTGNGGQAEVDSVKSFISGHPRLKGLIGSTPPEAW